MVMLPILITLLQQGVYAPQAGILQSQHMEVRANGVFLVEQNSSPAAQLLSGSTAAASIGPRWQQDDLGLAWIGQKVAMGDSGAWMVGGKDLNNESVAAYATGSATPLFDFSVLGASVVRPAASNRSGHLAALATFDTGGFIFQSTVYHWDRMHAGVPVWSATLPVTGNVIAGFVDVSEDGSRTVAAVSNTNGTTHIRVFDALGNIANSYDIAAAANIRFGAIDSRGDRLYLGLFNGFCEIYDLNTGILLYTQSLGGSFDAHAFSSDGKTFAYGNFGGAFVVQETSPGVWASVASRGGVGGAYIGQVALNADGSRCGFALQRFTPAYDHLEIGVFDVTTGIDMFNNSIDAPGTSTQLLASGLDMDDAGDYLAGISWGDSLNLTPEVFVYNASGALTSSVDTPGSAFGIDMDNDGDVVAVGTKAVHANTSGNGGSIWAVDTDDQGFHIVGLPQLGQPLSFETPGGANGFAFALSTGLASSVGPFGVQEIDMGLLVFLSNTFAIPTGGLALSLAVPNNPAFLGQAMHAQAIRLGASNTLTNKVSFDLVP